MEIDTGKVIKTNEDALNFFFKTPFFAFLDILGFKDLVKNNSHAKLVTLYQRLVQFPVEFYNDFHQQEEAERQKNLGEYFTPTGLRMANISDSILLWTGNSTHSSLIQLLSAIKQFMSIAMKMGIPLRGTVVMGDISILEAKQNISIIGRGLVHAYELEGKQQWSGCVVDEGIFTFLRSYFEVVKNRKGPIGVETMDSLLMRYNVPMKDKDNGKYEIELYAINWVDGIDMTVDEIKTSFTQHNKSIVGVEEKIENTISFYNFLAKTPSPMQSDKH